MTAPFKKPHLKIKGFSESQDYKYPQTKLRIDFPKIGRNRNAHGNRILSKLQEIRTKFELTKDSEIPADILWDDVIYVQFYSPWGYELKYDQFHDNSKHPKYQLLNIQKEIDESISDDKLNYRVRALVMLKAGGISHFIKRVEDYLSKNTKNRQGEETQNPYANDLISNIEEIQLATLEAFWTDHNYNPFPKKHEDVWWEVWFRKSAENEFKVLEQLGAIGAQIGSSRLEFAENIVRLVKATPEQLSNSLMLLDNLSELRKPQEMNDFITHESVSFEGKQEWLQDLVNRTDVNIDENGVLVCLLDSGVNNSHPLLERIIPDSNLYSWKEEWGKYDSEPNGGHGTGMAGLGLFGDLTGALAEKSRIQITYGVESFKVKSNQSNIDKSLFGVVYKDACYTPVIDRPDNLRVYCLSVTNKEFIFYGRPSSSSSALDSIAYGNEEEGRSPQLIIVSGGNIDLGLMSTKDHYPIQNFSESIHDPGQAYNSLTIGAYTGHDKLSTDKYRPLVKKGGMSPHNTTSACWETQWPNKPDLVFEGGNMATDGHFISSHEELGPISLDKNHTDLLFIPFGGTSAASALASKMAAELRATYPSYWPETIRGLMVHSADWTETMLQGRDFNGSEADRRAILRSVGYGVPNLEKAISSANNSLTLIAEEKISPYKKEKSSIRYNQYHLYTLPWPRDVLLTQIGEKDAKITVTLSYFIEPNPGNRQYSKSFSYHSHELDFKLIKPNESIEAFKRRISSAAEGLDEEESPNMKTENWTIRERIRSKGSIKKDFLNTSGAELFDRYYLAVYPKNGWFRTRKKLERYNDTVRYSLIISIETEDVKVDVYTPVENLIKTKVPVLN